jgi:membrane dipeptidase
LPRGSFAAGVRLLGLHHFADNDAGGSAHGEERGGLTAWGESLLRACETAGIAVDLAHSSQRVIADALRVATKPLLISHTGAEGACPSGRTLPDELLRAVAAQGVRYHDATAPRICSAQSCTNCTSND